jgi:hypothetical protein
VKARHGEIEGSGKFMTGFRPIVHAREGCMLGIRQPLDGPIFEKLEDAECWCIHAMASHYDRRLGISDARIEPFKGMVNCFAEPAGSLLKDVRCPTNHTFTTRHR